MPGEMTRPAAARCNNVWLQKKIATHGVETRRAQRLQLWERWRGGRGRRAHDALMEREQRGEWGFGLVVQGMVGEGGVDGAMRGMAAEEGPGHDRHGQRVAAYVTSRQMSEREI
jgi:hypothetical protein